MFTFIDNILERITNFFVQVLWFIVILLAVVLLVLASHRHNNNPYADHTKEKIEQQIEAEKEAKFNEALQQFYEYQTQGR